VDESRAPEHVDQTAVEEPLAGLERMYMQVYLRSKGHTLHSVHELPEQEAKRLMTEASMFASARLAEVEARAQFVQEIHGTAPPL
jgi:hypothetical protein